MRKCGLRRLVLVASVIGAVGLLSLPWYGAATGTDGEPISRVDWVNADETNPWPPGTDLTESPSYDGDGTADGDDGGTDGDGDGEPGGDGPTGEAGEPGSGPVDGGSGGEKAGGLLGLSFPVQAGMSVGLLALAFLALLPGRRMPANLR